MTRSLLGSLVALALLGCACHDDDRLPPLPPAAAPPVAYPAAPVPPAAPTSHLPIPSLPSLHFDLGTGPRVEGDGVPSSESRLVPSFRRISSEGSVDVELTQDATSSLVVSGDANLVSAIETLVEGDTLHVRVRPGSYHFRVAPLVRVHAPSVGAIATLGSGDVRARGIAMDRFEVRTSGSGDVSLEGRAGHLAVQVLGSGDVSANGLSAYDVETELMGSGDAEVRASSSVRGTTSGSGDVRVHGEGASVEVQSLGSGSVRRLP